MTQVAASNEEALEAWNGVLFDRFVQYRHLVVGGLEPHGEAALDACPPRPGDRVLDIGCGFGDTTRRLAGLVGPEGSALGVDVAPRFVETARAEAAALPNVRFEVHDVQVAEFAETFDHVFSRFGTMFFAAPGAAMRNVRRAMAPGGRLCIVVWRRREDNPWVYRAEEVVKPLVPEPEKTHLALGPAAEAVRLAGAEAQAVRPRLEAVLREALAGFETPQGVVGGASTWIVTAVAP